MAEQRHGGRKTWELTSWSENKEIILWLGVTSTWGTVFKGRSIRKVESHCPRPLLLAPVSAWVSLRPWRLLWSPAVKCRHSVRLCCSSSRSSSSSVQPSVCGSFTPVQWFPGLTISKNPTLIFSSLPLSSLLLFPSFFHSPALQRTVSCDLHTHVCDWHWSLHGDVGPARQVLGRPAGTLGEGSLSPRSQMWPVVSLVSFSCDLVAHWLMKPLSIFVGLRLLECGMKYRGLRREGYSRKWYF